MGFVVKNESIDILDMDKNIPSSIRIVHHTSILSCCELALFSVYLHMNTACNVLCFCGFDEGTA